MTSETSKWTNERKGGKYVCLCECVASTNFFFTPHKLCEIHRIHSSPFCEQCTTMAWPNVFSRTHYNINILFDKCKLCSDCNGIKRNTHTSMQSSATHVWKIWQQPKNNKRNNVEIITILLERCVIVYFSQFAIFLAAKCSCARRIYEIFSWQIRQTGMKWTTKRNDRSSFWFIFHNPQLTNIWFDY